MAYVAPTTGNAVAGSAILASDMLVVMNDVIDHEVLVSPLRSAWIAYTPTAIGGGISIGNGTFDAAYLKVGLLVVVRMRFTLGTTSSIGNGPAFTLPIAAASRVLPFETTLYDVSATTTYPGFLDPTSTDRMTFSAVNAAGTYATVATANASVPFTWAVGDQFFSAVAYTSTS